MAGPDLGKQIGPLPLGAWIVVVAGGLGIAVYTRRSGSSSDPTVTELPVDNTSGDAGVGTGAVGGFLPTTPTTGSTSVATPTTNDEWAVMVENGLIARNYPPATVDSMVRKYVSGATSTMSVAEYALLTVALSTYGAPPQTLPPDGNPPTTAPPSGSTGTTAPPSNTGTSTSPTLTNKYTARAGQSMYAVEKIAHPSMNAAQANNAALLAIHYNMAHGIKPWPTGMPGPIATQYKFKKSVEVYVW